MFLIVIDIVLFATFIGGFYFGLKSFLIKFSLSTRNKRLIGENWNGSVRNIYLKKLKSNSNDEALNKEIDNEVLYQKIAVLFWIIGFAIFVLLVILNGFFKWR